MKLSELQRETAAAHLRAEAHERLIDVYLDAAKAYVLSYTGLTSEQADEHPELTVAALILTADMYDNRQAIVDSDKINKVMESFLSAHDHNLLPREAAG